jgi:hypothetical protein
VLQLVFQLCNFKVDSLPVKALNKAGIEDIEMWMDLEDKTIDDL